MALPARVSKEPSGDVPLPVQDANDLDATLDRPEENQVIANGEHPQAWGEIKAGLPHERHGGQAVHSFGDAVQHAVGIGRAVLGDVAPDIHQVGLGARACEDAGHVTPAPTVPSLAGRGA